MSGVLKVLTKDAAELVANPRMLVLSFIVAPAILLLVGQLNVQPPRLSVLMSGLAECVSLRDGAQKVPARNGDLGAKFVAATPTAGAPADAGIGNAAVVIVAGLEPHSAAIKAGLNEGDTVVAIDGAALKSLAQLKNAIAAAAPGSEIQLTILRNGQAKEFPAIVDAEPWVEPPEWTVFRYLGELSYVRVECRPTIERDPFRTISRQDLDMLLNIRDGEEGAWSTYVKETNPRRIGWLLELARGIQVTRQQVTGVNTQALRLYKMSALGAVPVQPALMYYQQTADKSLALLPMTFSLIVCFLAFIIAAPSLIRERELHTLEILLGAPGIRGGTVLVGKILLPVAVSLFAAIVMLVLVQAVYGLYVKAHAELFLLFMVLPILSSTLLGLLVSALARSQVQTVMASAIYFFCLLLLSGFLYPAEASSTAVHAVTRLVCLTYLVDPANAWFFGAEPFRALPIVPLVIQCLLYLSLAVFAWHRQLRRI